MTILSSLSSLLGGERPTLSARRLADRKTALDEAMRRLEARAEHERAEARKAVEAAEERHRAAVASAEEAMRAALEKGRAEFGTAVRAFPETVKAYVANPSAERALAVGDGFLALEARALEELGEAVLGDTRHHAGAIYPNELLILVCAIALGRGEQVAADPRLSLRDGEHGVQWAPEARWRASWCEPVSVAAATLRAAFESRSGRKIAQALEVMLGELEAIPETAERAPKRFAQKLAHPTKHARAEACRVQYAAKCAADLAALHEQGAEIAAETERAIAADEPTGGSWTGDNMPSRVAARLRADHVKSLSVGEQIKAL